MISLRNCGKAIIILAHRLTVRRHCSGSLDPRAKCNATVKNSISDTRSSAVLVIMDASLPYHEPSITAIVILSGFLILLNVVDYGLDRLVYCGLIGQVLLGIAWGTPGSKWLPAEIEAAVVQLGYLGLILLVYEGCDPKTSAVQSPLNDC